MKYSPKNSEIVYGFLTVNNDKHTTTMVKSTNSAVPWSSVKKLTQINICRL